MSDMIETLKAWIDSVTYEELLRKWRFAPSGDPMFQGKLGKYYKDKMAQRRDEIPHEEQVRASKNIG